MFTLKFMKDGETSVVCGKRYDISNRWIGDEKQPPSFAIVTTYSGLTSDTPGVDYEVGGDRGYHICWVENEAGKTIDKIGPFGDPRK